VVTWLLFGGVERFWAHEVDIGAWQAAWVDIFRATGFLSASIIGRPVGVSSPDDRGADSDHGHAYENDECAAHHNTSNLSSRRSR
jgi:hypothetical protein